MSVVTKVLREAYKGVVSVYSQIAQGNNTLLSLCSDGRFALAQGVVSLRFTIACGYESLVFLLSLGSPPARKPGELSVLHRRGSDTRVSYVNLRRRHRVTLPSLTVSWCCTCDHHQRMNKGIVSVCQGQRASWFSQNNRR